MYLDEYKRWLAADLEDADLKPELSKIEGNDEEIKDRFAVALKFGTAGLRGVLGAGTNRMNIYVVRQATQGLANWVKTQGGSQTVAISYDSRLKSDVFAKTAAGVLAANGIKVRIYDALMPVPALSFATRYYECNAGIMVTASHNPAKYNGYKAYGPDGCQMTDDAAAIVYDEIQKTDVLTGAKYISFAAGVEQGLIRFVGDDCKKALYDGGSGLEGALKAGITTEFLSIEEAAEHYGMPVDAVKEEIARYNTFVENKLDEDFKKPIPDDAQTIDEPPFYGVRLWPKVHHCMGGVKTDLECRVVDMDLQVIPGLYAAGEAVGGIHGACRLGSCATADCLVNGRIAGQNAAKEQGA